MRLARVIAVAGKGGVGKSTLSGLLVLALAERAGEVVLAVDADPNSNLGEKLGIEVERTIGDLREDLLDNANDIPAGVGKHEHVRYNIRLALSEGENFDLLTMGRPEGPGCYCYINNILRTFMDDLVDDYPYVIVDNEAGMEHLSRRTTRRMDLLALVSDPTKLGIDTASRIRDLAHRMDIEIGRELLLLNRAPEEMPRALVETIDSSDFDEVVLIPNDARVEDLAVLGTPLTALDGSSRALRAVRRLAAELG